MSEKTFWRREIGRVLDDGRCLEMARWRWRDEMIREIQEALDI